MFKLKVYLSKETSVDCLGYVTLKLLCWQPIIRYYFVYLFLDNQSIVPYKYLYFNKISITIIIMNRKLKDIVRCYEIEANKY